MLDIIHIHGFKCAGTTFQNILSREYQKKLLLVESKKQGKRLFADELLNSNELKPYHQSISSHLLAISDDLLDLSKIGVSFIRHPYKRIMSAWRFQFYKQKTTSDNFKKFLDNYKGSLLSNYQSKLLSNQKKSTNFYSGWEFNVDLEILFGDDFFVGVVEHFDESMVVLEHLLQEKGISIDLSYPKVLNTTGNLIKEKHANLLRYGYSAFDSDLWLHKIAIENLNSKIKNIDDFSKKLSDYKERCKSSRFIKRPQKVSYISN